MGPKKTVTVQEAISRNLAPFLEMRVNADGIPTALEPDDIVNNVTLSRTRRLPEPGPSRLPDRLPDDQPCIDKQTKPKKGGTQVPLVLKCSVASCPLRRVKPNLAVGNPLTKLPLNPDPARVTLPSLKSSVLDHRSVVHQEPTPELQKY